jgi:DNA-binding CsgD family transcriptional regulator
MNLALQLADSINNATQIAACSQLLANYFVRTGDPGTGMKWAQEALRVGQAHGLKKSVYEAMTTIRSIFLQQKEIALAYHYDKLANMMKDSLDLDANNALLSKLELQYELDKSAQEKRMAEQRKLAATLLILVVLIAAVVILVLLYFRFRLRSKYYRLQNEKLETELEFKNKELASNVMSLMKKNEILSEITQQLIDLKQKAAKDETREAIDHIAGDLQKSMDVKIWEEFELRFRQVHKDFYDKLLQKYPDLSPNEQKLCAFLRLNMTNKEISELTGQSIKALETARYRLRIKFGISNSQVNLITFLSSI